MLTKDTLEEFKLECELRRHMSRTIKGYHNSTLLFLTWQKQGKFIIETFTGEEVRSLLEVFDFSTFLSARNKLILAIAFDSGACNTEMCNPEIPQDQGTVFR